MGRDNEGCYSKYSIEDPNLTALRTISNLIDMVILQCTKIDELQACNKQNGNLITDDLEYRTTELERYSRKTCLIFNSLDLGPEQNPVKAALSVINTILQVPVTEADLVACHGLRRGHCVPVIVKFMHHWQRDLVWQRKKWLRGLKNSEGRFIMLEECLAPADRVTMQECRKRNLKAMKIKQQVYLLNNNETGTIKVNSLKDLENLHKEKKDQTGPYQAYAKAPNRPNNANPKTHGRFNLTAAKEKAHGRFNLLETPIILPPLTRKPTVRKRSHALSPLEEQLAEKVMESNCSSSITASPAFKNA